MGITYIDVTVSNPAVPGKRCKVQFLLDSGVVISLVPRHVLEELGIHSHSKREFTLANGEKIELEMGTAAFEYESKRGDGLVVFGDEKSTPLLGATTLEGFGYILDPYNRRLCPLPMMLA